MFKNSVVRPGVSSRMWVKYSAIRAIKTMAQTFVASIGTATVISSVDWKTILSMSLLSGIISIMTSIAGIPEVPNREM